MLKIYSNKFFVLLTIQIFIFIFSIGNIAYGVEFNDDIQKTTLDYQYFDGFGDDKIIRSTKDKSWHLLKSDGTMIKFNIDYLDYAGIENGKYFNFDDDYYRFVVRNEANTTRFVYANKNGIECTVDGYSFAYPTMSDKYWLLINSDSDLNYKVGLYDKYNKKEVIPAIYDNLSYINDDTIIARTQEGEGIININQKNVIPFKYNLIEYINDSFIIALNSDGKFGVVNIKNEEVLAFEYDEIHKVSESSDYCRLGKNNKFGLISIANGAIVIPVDYDSIYYVDKEYIENELVVAQKDDKMGIIDVNNKEVVPFIYERIDLTGRCFEVYKYGLAGLLDNKGKEILPAELIDIMEVADGFITARVYVENYDHKYAVYNFNGEEIVPPIYDYIDYDASEKYMIVNNNGIANLVDKATGEAVLTDSFYSDIRYINDKYFAGGNSSYYSIVNFAGQRLTPSYYSNVDIANVNGEELLAAEWQTSRSFDRNINYFKQTKGPSSWATEEVAKAIESNLVPFEHQAAYTFNIKRHEFCSIIVKFLEQYYDTSRKGLIKDNNIDVINPPIIDGFNDDVVICLNLGIVNGRGNGIFDGESEITREEAAVMLNNLSKYLGNATPPEEKFIRDNSDVSPWAKDSVNFVLQNEIMQGVGYGMFYPKSNITREQTYIIVYRMLEAIEIAKTDKVTLLTNLSSEDGNYKGLTVKTRDNSKSFPWENVTNPTNAPTINTVDLDGDGKDEIIVILVTGTGTGIHDEKIHILNLEDLTELNIEDPFEAIKNRVSSSIVINEVKVNITINWNDNTLEKVFDKSSAGMWFNEIVFHNVIHYEIENTKVIARVNGQMSPAGFPITAIVEYNENLKVKNIEIEDNELDKGYEE